MRQVATAPMATITHMRRTAIDMRCDSVAPAAAAVQAVAPCATTLLQLMRLASPALPVGGFSYSEGLEALIHSADAATESVAAEWLIEMLQLNLARSDLAVLAQATCAWRAQDTAQVAALNQWVLTTRESSEFRAQTLQMGKSLVEWLRNDTQRPQAEVEWLAEQEPTFPVAFALALASTGATVRDGLLAYASGWADNVVQAAIKAVPLGQRAGQRMLARLAAEIPAAVDQAIALADADRQSYAPMLAILSAQHEVQYSRLFRS